MLNLIRDPAWQGIGVIVTIVLGFIGFYYAGKNKIWLYFSAVIVIFIIGFGLGTTIRDTTFSSIAPIAVDSVKGWQETGISVNRGDNLTIDVIGGGWTMGRRKLNPQIAKKVKENYLASDPYYSNEPKYRILGGDLWHYLFAENLGEGYASQCTSCPVAKANPGSLVAKIVNASPKITESFEAKNGTVYTANIDGMLHLRMNDADVGLDDNAGMLLVKVKVNSLN